MIKQRKKRVNPLPNLRELSTEELFDEYDRLKKSNNHYKYEDEIKEVLKRKIEFDFDLLIMRLEELKQKSSQFRTGIEPLRNMYENVILPVNKIFSKWDSK